jgi:hypothetical protein
MKLWSVYNLQSGRIMRMLGQVRARNEKAALAAIKAHKVDLSGLNLFVREAAFDQWHRPPKT